LLSHQVTWIWAGSGPSHQSAQAGSGPSHRRLEPGGFRAIPSVPWWPELPRRAIPLWGALELGGFRAIPSVLPSWAAYLGGRAIPLPPGRPGGLPNRAIPSSGAPGLVEKELRAIPLPLPPSAPGATGFGAIPYDQWSRGWLCWRSYEIEVPRLTCVPSC
jgi:hypothetical protein